MRYELTDCEWFAIKPLLPTKPRGLPRVNDRHFSMAYSGSCARAAVARSARELRAVYHLL